MFQALHRTRNANIVSAVVLLVLLTISVVMIVLPNEYAVWLISIWTLLAIIGNVACAYAVYVRWKQRQSVINPDRLLPDRNRRALRSIANANVRREAVRGAEFGLFLVLGLVILFGLSNPIITRGVIVLMQTMLLGNVIYDLIEMAYTDQFFDAPASGA